MLEIVTQHSSMFRAKYLSAEAMSTGSWVLVV